MGYRLSANPPTKRPGSGIPVGRMIVICGALGLLGLVALGTRQVMDTVKFVDISLVGEWQAPRKPWRLVFRPDKTIVSSTGPSQLSSSESAVSEPNGSKSGPSEAWTSEPGTYSVDYSGTLWVKLKNGKYFTAALAAESPNRFDLIESGTDDVTAFQRVLQPKPNPPDSLKKSLD
jgi:hypothetical protein